MHEAQQRGVAVLSAFAAMLLSFALAQPALAQRVEWPPQLAAAEPWPETEVVADFGPFVSDHQLKVHGEAVAFRTTVEGFAFDQADGMRDAVMSVTSYERPDRAGPARPVIFGFNGGPGGSSVWLNLGVLGPRLLSLPADPTVSPKPPYQLMDNPDSVLDYADVVLLDMVGTGFGRLLNKAGDKYYYSTPGDGAYFANAIRHWLKAHNRVGAPVFLVGESYGTQRAAIVASNLLCVQDTPCTPTSLKGVVLMSQDLASPGFIPSRGTDLASLAGVACFHKKVDCHGRSIEAFMREADKFAAEEYVGALYRGASLTSKERIRIATRLSGFTGLSAKFFLDNDLYVGREEFRIKLFEDRNEYVGRFDGRYLRKRTGEGSGDPSFDELNAALAAGAEQLYGQEFGVKGVRPFSIFVREAPFEWRYSRVSVPWTNFNSYRYMAAATLKAPDLKVFMAGGYFDGATGYGADQFVLNHWGIDPSRVTVRHYFGGHMFYMVPETRAKFVGDLRRFIGAPN